MFDHLLHFPCMLSYSPKVSGDFNRVKGVEDREMSSCYGRQVCTGASSMERRTKEY